MSCRISGRKKRKDQRSLREKYDSNDCIRNVRAIGLTVEMLQARLSIIDLLLIGLDKPAASLSHFLLGFDLKKQASLGGQGGVARSVRGATFIKGF